MSSMFSKYQNFGVLRQMAPMIKFNLIIVFTFFTMTEKVTACKVPFIDHWYLLPTANINVVDVLSTRTLVVIL